MSKKHHNYTNYSKPQEAPVVEPEVVEEVITEEPVVTPEPETTEPDEIIGEVVNCQKLNVRKEPSLDTDIVTVLSAGVKVMVDIFESTADFYKVVTEAGVEGYCIKEKINID